MKRKAIKIILILIATILVIGISLFAPVDRQPLYQKDFYRSMMAQLDTVSIEKHNSDTLVFTGWASESIIPEFVTPMAGYSPRGRYEDVHDSLLVHALILDNGSARVALVSYDLLITPPMLNQRIQNLIASKIPEIDFIYISASHTHNGIGGWDKSPGGQLMTGNFNAEILDHLESKTLECLNRASKSIQRSTISYFEVPAHKYVQNRLNDKLSEDGMIRGIEVLNDEQEKAILSTFSAHATNIPASSLSISGDYPAQLTGNLKKSGYAFAMFMAGTVGSHRLDSIEGESFNRIKSAGTKLSELILQNKKHHPLQNTALSFANIPIEFGRSQLRVSKNFRIRDWAFSALFAPLKGKIQYLKIGDVLLLGMPCDFSGEILIEKGMYDLADALDTKLIITSFNGDYVGYITEDHHYDITKRSEIREMNWVGPYYGDYFSEIVSELIQKQ